MKRIVLCASEGMMLTNGEVFGKTVYPAEADKVEKWYEIAEEEYQKIMKEREEN